MRCPEERTRENLAGIIDELKSMDADIYLLQEVDECSRRTYRIDELELLREAFPGYHLYFAYNYKIFLSLYLCWNRWEKSQAALPY